MIGGRRWWLAWPAGIVCVGVVGGLVYLAAPAVPGVATFAFETLQRGFNTPPEPLPTAKPLAQIGTALTDDCVSLYPTALWLGLTIDPHTVLSQTQSPPASDVTAALARWHPTVRMTCSWRQGSGGIVRTSLIDLAVSSTGSADASSGDATQRAIAAALAGKGYGCRLSVTTTSLLTCTRAQGTTTDTEVFAGPVWLSTTEAGWHPEGYVDAMVERFWPTPVR
jgi:hypothetical protein